MKKVLSITILMLVGLFFTGCPIYENASAEENFSVTPLETKKGDLDKGYFDLKVTPGQKKQLKLKVSNHGTNKINIKIELNNAFTNNNGLTAYDYRKERDPTLSVGFSDMATVASDEISLGVGESKNIMVAIKVPEKPFKGVILGGLRFSNADNVDQSKSKQARVANRVAYVVGVVLKESKQEIKAKINLNKVFIEQYYQQKYLSVNLHNSQPTLVTDLSVKAQIFSKGNSRILYETAKDKMRMAPNSNFDFKINLKNQLPAPGKYTVLITGKANGEVFNLKKDFLLKKEENELNSEIIVVQNKKGLSTGLKGLVIVIIVSLMLYIKLRRANNGNEVF